MNKVVVITGVSKGLGRALVDEFVAKGWTVAGCANSSPVMQEMQRLHGTQHLFSAVDVRDTKAVEAWAQQVKAHVGVPHILINNAGIINKPAHLWEVRPQEFEDVMKVNVLGVFNMLHSFMPMVLQNQSGIVINVGSSSGKEGEANFVPYCTSKFAIEGLTQALAKEMPQGMAVVSLDPGDGINTDMLKLAYPQENPNNFPTPAQWAQKAVPFILKIGSQNNGQSLVVK